MNERGVVRRFLERHGMGPGAIAFDGLVNDILAEMRRGLAGEPSSLAMIPTYLRPVERLPAGEPVLAIDAGGTNFRAALVSFGPEGPRIESFRSRPMPGTAGEVSREAFFDALASYVADLAPRVSRIGFCFSYPMLITADRDGRLLHFTKEIRAPAVEGTLVGAGLREGLERTGVRGRRSTVLLNDTTATLLAGRSAAADARQYDSYVGYILGTGSNVAYVERAIPKAPGAGEQIVVLESGQYAISAPGDIDEAFDRTTLDPGRGRYEKLYSGGYLGGLVLSTLRTAAGEGLLSARSAERIARLEGLTAKDLAVFLARPWDGATLIGAALGAGAAGSTGPADADRDTERAYHLTDALVERAAMLSAAVLSASVVQSGRGTLHSRPVCIAVDGTTWRGLHRLAARAEAMLHDRLEVQRERYTRIVTPENGTLLGAAVAGLAVG